MDTPKANDIIKSFTITSDKNRTFNINFQNKSSSSLYIYAYFQNEITKIEYENNFSLEGLKDNKYLSLFDTINDIFEEIISILNKNLKEVKIIEEQAKITINIPIGGTKMKPILLNLNEKEKNEKQQISELFTIISNLKKENNELKSNQIKLEERIKYLESFINDINSLKELKAKIEKKEKEKLDNKRIRNLKSLVLGENDDYNKCLKNWINPNSKIKAELLYRLSRDGKEYQTFHNLCDNKGKTLTIFKLNDGNILGGYTTQNWDSNTSGIWKQDQYAFLFSLTEKVKCVTNSNSSYNAIYCNSGYGPYFEAIRFYGKKMDEPYIYNSSSYYNESNKLYPGKSGYFKADEVEIFKIIIN